MVVININYHDGASLILDLAICGFAKTKSTSVTMLMGWMVGASTKAGKAGSVHAIKVSLGRDSPVVTWDSKFQLCKIYLCAYLEWIILDYRRLL